MTISTLHSQVEAKLASRLEAGIKSWTESLSGPKDNENDTDIGMDTDSPDKPIHKPGGEPKVKTHVICILSTLFV